MRGLFALCIAIAAVVAVIQWFQGAESLELLATLLTFVILFAILAGAWKLFDLFLDNLRSILGGAARVLRVFTWIAGTVCLVSMVPLLLMNFLEWMGMTVAPGAAGQVIVTRTFFLSALMWPVLAVLAWLLRALFRRSPESL